MFLLGVVLMVIGVAISIALHELGHMAPAKKFGVKVTQYMIGFGPTVFSRRRGETEYGVKAIPLGGYIRMVGMFPPAPGEDPNRVRASSTGRWSQLVDQARDAAFEEIEPHEAHRVFYKLPTHRKVIIMFGGPFMNLVIAAVLLIIIACGIGLPTQVTADVGSVMPCLATSSGSAPKTCPTPSPAAAAGLRTGDRIESVDGVKVSTTTGATKVIRAHPQQQIPMVVLRDGVRRTLHITPALRTLPKTDAQGNPVLNWSGRTETIRGGLIGAGIGGTNVVRRQPLTDAPSIVGDGVRQTASVFVKIPQKMVGVFNAAFGSGQRDPNGPMSVVGVGRVAGDVTESHQVSTVDKVELLLGLLASLNLALFVFNLVPLLPLDGGHIAGALWEAVKRPIARARGLKGPIYVDVAKALPVAYGVSMVLLVMFGLLFYADIVNPVKLN
ncbi:site-2 protease family protein [Allobranchiibius sp. GilTou38]|uniref:M50 family metallopeptidase n=1 Tax=Allobranchiibius sp. GilTou38 TaxID=2815210 RepID=UPI001AA13625|nr:site-2 protease family protein [Allobranchiibius sp. GilTou38]MBO1765291.1 site-2 protease family protein [Allobranchiibius sp. GilTou38]